jgi:hypothetical protein
MSALDREDLSDVCRQIYLMAGNDFILPPLLRDVNALGQGTRHIYYGLTNNDCVRFIAELDKAYLNQSSFPLSRLPLTFKCELCDLDFKETPVELSESESRELIRAFFLGAKTPINTELNPVTRGIKFSIQLSSSFFVDCGELSSENSRLTPEEICGWVSGCLYDKSKDFFGDAQDGVEVWTTRVMQELLGESKPLPETFWPHEPLRTDAVENAAPIVAVAAVAAVDAVAANPPVPVSETLSHHIAWSPVGTMTGVLPAKRARLRYSALAMLIVMASASCLPLIARTPAHPTYSTPRAVSTSTDEAPRVVARLDLETPPERILPTEPPPESGSGSATIPSSKPDCVLPALAGGALQPEASKPSRPTVGKAALVPKSEMPAHRSVPSKAARRRFQPQQINPIVAVGRAASKVVAGVVTNLQRLPYRLSAMIR